MSPGKPIQSAEVSRAVNNSIISSSIDSPNDKEEQCFTTGIPICGSRVSSVR